MKPLHVIIIGIFILGTTSYGWSAEKKAQLIFSEMTAKPGQKIKIPVLLNNVPNMAGIKLALKFDKDLLTYKKSEKTKTTASLMHIVNDKHKGKLVIVMAGARGVPVNNQSIMNLYFQVNESVSKPVDTKFKVTELQLMTDALKELAYEYKIHPIHIQASQQSNAKPANAKKEPVKAADAKKESASDVKKESASVDNKKESANAASKKNPIVIIEKDSSKPVDDSNAKKADVKEEPKPTPPPPPGR